MNRRIDRIITETINKFIKENVTNEVNNNLKFSEFDRTMSDLGFKRINKTAPGIAYIMPPYEGEVSMHIPHDGSTKADMIRNTVKFLKKIKWFDNPENYKKFPFKRWGVSENMISRDTTQDEIMEANEMYADAEIFRVFYNDYSNPLCVMQTEEGYNLCRSEDDRRPLYDIWFNEFVPGDRPLLKYDNWDMGRTEVYPILPNGKLDEKGMMEENRMYR